jgi:hypothetical protein
LRDGRRLDTVEELVSREQLRMDSLLREGTNTLLTPFEFSN